MPLCQPSTPSAPAPGPAAGLPGCAVLAGQLGEPHAGTATAIRSWLLLEQRGPWSRGSCDAVLEQVLPTDRLAQLTGLRATAGLRPLLIRRPGRSRSGPLTVLLASSVAGRSWIERLTVDDLHEVAAVDLARLAAGEPGQGEPVTEPVYLVCTHGAKDLCCAVQGRPVAAALAAVAPDEVWECTHLGGHRFAANVAVLPDGLLYGRVPPERAAEIALTHTAGRLVPDLLRGRTRDPVAAQAAEVALRRSQQLTGLTDVTVVDTRPGEHGVLVRLETALSTVEFTVDEVELGCSGMNSCSGESRPSMLRAQLTATSAR